MAGEDVYDVAVWCPLCQAAHSPCELDDLDFVCLKCGKSIPFSDEPEDGFDDPSVDAYHPQCRPAHIAALFEVPRVEQQGDRT